jgi:hypothetical protein
VKSQAKKTHANYIAKHWRGELSLPVSYWVNGVLATIVTFLTIFGLRYVIALYKVNYAALIYWALSIVVVTAVVIWQNVGIWRSADRYTAKGWASGSKFWSTLAKLMVIIGTVNLASEYQKTFVPALKESYQRATWLSEETWKIDLSNDGREIEISGVIKHGLSDQFLAALNSAPNVKYVHVNLHKGGLVDEAINVRKIIHERQLSTYVSSECVSACTLVFLGGKQRLIRKYARIGFHAYSFPGVNKQDMDFSGFKNDLIKLGLKREFVRKIFETHENDMWFPSASELISANVIHEVVEGDQFQLDGTDYSPITKVYKDKDNALKNIESAETLEQSMDAVKEFNKNQQEATSALAARARSSESFKFVEYTEKQNELAKRGNNLVQRAAKSIKALENISPESADERDQELVVSHAINLCKTLREYIPLISQIVDILDIKIELAEKPIVGKELFENDQREKTFLQQMRDSQANILKEEEAAYQKIYCDTILSLN